MLNIMIFSLLFALSTSMFDLSIALNGAREMFKGIDASFASNYVKVTVDNVGPGQSPTPFFDMAAFDQGLKDYFAANVSPYLASKSFAYSRKYSNYYPSIDNPMRIRITYTFETGYGQAKETKYFNIGHGATYGQ